MCAIAGAYSFSGDADGALHRCVQGLLTSMKHRGPDHYAVREYSPGLVLGSARLGVVDRYNSAAQMPFESLDGAWSIAFNGELYNHEQVRLRLDCSWRTRSDTETLLAAFAAWGQRAFLELTGMFACAIFNRINGQLTLAVDPNAQKPLYYIEASGCFFFASEIYPLLEHVPVRFHLDYDALREAFHQRFISMGRTHVKEIRRLEPGMMLTVMRDGRVHTQRYYTVPNPDIAVVDDYYDLFRSAIANSFPPVSRAEVPTVCFLSSGIDSSLVLAHANVPISAYTIRFQRPPKTQTFDATIPESEVDDAQAFATHCGVPHHVIEVTASDFTTRLDQWSECMGEPLLYNETAAYLSLLNALPHEVRVVLSGACADEIFDGYGFSETIQDHSMRGVAEAYVHRFGYNHGVDPNSVMVEPCSTEALIEAICARTHVDGMSGPREVRQRLCALMRHCRLPCAELAQLDRAGMRYGIECRAPFAERAIYETLFKLYPETLSKIPSLKNMLRRVSASILPTWVCERPKRAFAPLGEFFSFPPMKERVMSIFSANAPVFTLPILDRAAMQRLIQADTPSGWFMGARAYVLNRMLSQQRRFLYD